MTLDSICTVAVFVWFLLFCWNAWLMMGIYHKLGSISDDMKIAKNNSEATQSLMFDLNIKANKQT